MIPPTNSKLYTDRTVTVGSTKKRKSNIWKNRDKFHHIGPRSSFSFLPLFFFCTCCKHSE